MYVGFLGSSWAASARKVFKTPQSCRRGLARLLCNEAVGPHSQRLSSNVAFLLILMFLHTAAQSGCCATINRHTHTQNPKEMAPAPDPDERGAKK